MLARRTHSSNTRPLRMIKTRFRPRCRRMHEERAWRRLHDVLRHCRPNKSRFLYKAAPLPRSRPRIAVHSSTSDPAPQSLAPDRSWSASDKVIKQLPLKTFVTFDARANPGQGIASAGPRANISCKNLSAPAVVLGCSQSPAQSLEQPKQSLARKRRGT